MDLIKVKVFPFQVSVERLRGQATDLETTSEESMGGAGQETWLKSHPSSLPSTNHLEF